jgi:hypothetical protein
MVWPDQDPPTTDVLLYVNVPCAGGNSPAYRKIDKLPDSRYRAIVGTLFEHPEICRTGDLDALVRYGNAMASADRSTKCSPFQANASHLIGCIARRRQPRLHFSLVFLTLIKAAYRDVC